MFGFTFSSIGTIRFMQCSGGLTYLFIGLLDWKSLLVTRNKARKLSKAATKKEQQR